MLVGVRPPQLLPPSRHNGSLWGRLSCRAREWQRRGKAAGGAGKLLLDGVQRPRRSGREPGAESKQRKVLTAGAALAPPAPPAAMLGQREI